MEKFALEIKPYNDLFIDCVYNKLVSILSSVDRTFERMAPLLSRNYSIYLKGEGHTMSPEVESARVEEGLFVLEVTTEMPGIEHVFEYREIERCEDIHAEIKTLLHEGYYVFIVLDRIHFLHGVEYGHRSFLHPSLIYGYDNSMMDYLLIDDCVSPRTFDYYSLSHENFNKAFQAALAQGAFVLRGVKVKSSLTAADLHHMGNKIEKMTNNLQTLLSESLDRTSYFSQELGIVKKSGISCLLDYADTIEEQFPKITVSNLPIHFALAAFPVDFQRTNLEVVHLLYQDGFLHAAQKDSLCGQYEKLKSRWELHKHMIFKYIYKKQEKLPVHLGIFGELAKYLREIYQEEKAVSEQFLSYLRK